MRPDAGDIHSVALKGEPPRGRFGIRIARTQPAMRVSYISVTGDDGHDWICVLPLDKDVLGTRLNHNDLVWIPVGNVGARLSTVDPASYDVIYKVLQGEDPRYPWIAAELSDHAEPPPRTGPEGPERYPSMREALGDLIEE
ncbi:hypothetical protein [Planotetraspora kaengkrachanensis]|uniref:Uncharacterized protein n=1 Tax=Planotetraspora kaengkrachanensis TaxID=575193 RepID=A0A8J3LSJ5_9ACTN|nr:hypothetical protein [Planotetraspora kaengkrachanensis]GIG77982.1 hypothetical protein Pka01_11090 [Planotetraspora kaengkrachanensis]